MGIFIRIFGSISAFILTTLGLTGCNPGGPVQALYGVPPEMPQQDLYGVPAPTQKLEQEDIDEMEKLPTIEDTTVENIKTSEK